MIGSLKSVPRESLSVTCSRAGWLFSSTRLASVTEAQAKEREAKAIIAKRDLIDFMIVIEI